MCNINQIVLAQAGMAVEPDQEYIYIFFTRRVSGKNNFSFINR